MTIFDATTDGPLWTLALAAAILFVLIRFFRRERADWERDQARQSRRREMARQARDWSAP